MSLLIVSLIATWAVAAPQQKLDGPTEIVISDLPLVEPTTVVAAPISTELAPANDPSGPSRPNSRPQVVLPQPTYTSVPATAVPATMPQVGAGSAGNVILICPPGLLPGMSRWISYRQNQGYRIVQIDGMLTSVDLLQTVRRFASRELVTAIVIVGDADLTMDNDPSLRQYCVPSIITSAKVISKLGSESHIATDMPYADFDADQVPDVPIGRLCVDSPDQLAIVVDKIIRYEQLSIVGDWRQTVHLAAGIGDFGILADTVIETIAKKFLADGIPAEYRTTMTYGNWRSPYCPDPRLFRETMLSQVREGCLFWVYMGHGRPHRLDRFQVGDNLVPILEAGDVPRFRSKMGMPIAVLLACYTGAYDQPRDCLAERLLKTPEGPVAVLAASRVTLPYSMSILGTGMMDEFFAHPQSTLGRIVLQGKRNLASDGGKHRKLIDSVARTISPTKEELADERREHQYTFNLFGDPLLIIRQPRKIQLEGPSQVTQGEKVRVVGRATIGGECTVELVCRRDRTTFSPPRRKMPADESMASAMTETYYRANDARWNQRRFPIRPGPFSVEISVPQSARGPSHVRLKIENQADVEVGATDVYIRQAGGNSKKKDRRTSNSAR